jgi:hypothetical protein
VLVVLITTCAVSLLTNGYLTLHLLGSASLYWSLLPLTTLAGLAAADRRWPEPRRVHDYFRSYLPWVVWLTAASAYFAAGTRGSMVTDFVIWEIAAVLALLAAWWMDWRFFANGLQFAVSRAVSLVLWIAIFAAEWPWSEFAWRLSR